MPWRVAEMHGRLRRTFEQLARPDGPGYAVDNVVFFASVMSHYIGDSYVPFHAVVNYDGQVTGQLGIHSRFESELFSRLRPTLKIAPPSMAPVTDARAGGVCLADRRRGAGDEGPRGRSSGDRHWRSLRRRVLHPLCRRRRRSDPGAAGQRGDRLGRGAHHRRLGSGGEAGPLQAASAAGPAAQARTAPGDGDAVAGTLNAERRHAGTLSLRDPTRYPATPGSRYPIPGGRYPDPKTSART